MNVNKREKKERKKPLLGQSTEVLLLQVDCDLPGGQVWVRIL
jgi:hypothetical protein